MSYTVMGDTVNLASRLEGANKFFHSKIMVSEYTYEEAKDFVEARMLGAVRVVGKAIPVKFTSCWRIRASCRRRRPK